ncbi:MAG: NAD(P)-dependent oxidoreductase [Chloroflexota bacterium]|nr:NAD(P)-dependent oxidoreductase [Chloroflexota bacterium]
MKTVLVTGGAGSVGCQLVTTFVQHGDRVRAFDLPFCDFSLLESLSDVEIIKGDITDAETVQAAVRGVDAVVHLAALLPPASERDRARTFEVNVGGTENLLKAIERDGGQAHLVFSSSISTYGDTTAGDSPIRVSHPQHALDIYAESKIVSERLLRASEISYTILRIAGISVPEFLEPPDPWPFMADQRVEFINREDVIVALFASVQQEEARGEIFNIAGGPSWQVTGHEYAKGIYEAMDIPIEIASYATSPGWLDWYDTSESQAALGYQRTLFPRFLELLRKATEAALA